MALKGTTKIELTNVKTGEREVIEKDNLVTNAVADVLQMNPFGMKHGYYHDFETNWFPVCPNLIGGILLFENELEENAEKYFAQGDNPVIGYSSNDVNSGTDVKRGSLNQTESGVLDTNDGYRFVFDFETSQANGTISAVGLTSKWGGASGYGSNVLNSKSVYSITSQSYTTDAVKRIALGNLVSVDADKEIGYSVALTADNSIIAIKTNLGLTKVGLVTKEYPPANVRVISEEYIAPETFGKFGSPSYLSFLDDGDGYIWGFQHNGNAAGNSSGDANILWIKIKKEDWSFTEGTWNIDAQINTFGSRFFYEAKSSGIGLNRSIIDSGYLYCVKYNNEGIYRIKLNNITDVTLLKFDNGRAVSTLVSSNTVLGTRSDAFVKIGNTIRFTNGYIQGDKLIYVVVSSSTTPDLYTMNGWFHYGPFIMALNFTNDSNKNYPIYWKLQLMTPYLATINNLPTPVEKTADKTMKITYILREES